MANMVRFYSKPKQNKAKTAEAGRPIYDEIEMCEVIVAGDKHFRPHFPAHEITVTYDAERQRDDKRTWAERYPAEYKAFKQQGFTSIEGTPVETWPLLTRAQVAEMKALDIYTVEQIADMNERNRAVLGPNARTLIAQAQTYIQSASDTALPTKQAAEIEALRTEIERLKAAQVAPVRGEDEYPGLSNDDLKDRIAEISGHAPKGNPRRATLVRALKALEAA